MLMLTYVELALFLFLPPTALRKVHASSFTSPHLQFDSQRTPRLHGLLTLAIMMDSDEPQSGPLRSVQDTYAKLQRQYQQILDRWTPYMLNRWLATTGLLAVFFLRIVLARGVSEPLSYLCH